MIQFLFSFAVASIIFALALEGAALGLWVLWHFVAWTPFTGLPWGCIRFMIAAAMVLGTGFACSDDAKKAFK